MKAVTKELDGIEWVAYDERPGEWTCRALGFIRLVAIDADGRKWHCLRGSRGISGKGFTTVEEAAKDAVVEIRKIAKENIEMCQARLKEAKAAAKAVGA